MKTINLTRAKARLSEVLRWVERGETVLLLRRGRAVARVLPVPSSGGEDEGARLARLEREGRLRRPSRPPDFSFLRRLRTPRLPKGKGLVEAILEEREKGR